MEPPDDVDQRQRGHFYRPGTSEPARFQLERLKPPLYRMMRQVEYVDKLGIWYRLPADVEHNTTDLASIPPFLTWLIPKDGTHTPAALLHDAIIGGRQGVEFETSSKVPIDDRHGDYLFREAMKWSGVPWLRRWLMWAAVSLRTLTVKRTLDTSNGDVKESKYYVRIAIIGVLVAGWAIVSAVLALDVPDLLRSDRDLPWIGDRLWWAEILRALLTIAAGTAILTVVFGAALRSRRALSCGALAGVAVGFLGLPMIASLVGAIGYYVLQWLVARVTSPA